MQKAALYTSGALFAAGTVFHVVRLFTHIGIVVAEMAVTLWRSFPGALAAAALAFWMLVAARRS